MLIRMRRYLEYKLGPAVQSSIDMVITALFYLLIFGLAFVGPVKIVQEARQSTEPLHLADIVFIAFLPLLVVFGFFVFYKQSLRPLIGGAYMDNQDYDKASSLMMLTKKLFISSLISYLFIKLIELLFPQAPVTGDLQNAPPENYFLRFYHTGSPELQVLLIGAAILILMLFYIYLNNHRFRHSAKGLKDNGK